MIGVQAGAIYIDAAAREYFKRVLTDESNKDAPKKEEAVTTEDVEEYTARGVKDFEMSAKRTFRGIAEEKTIDIASRRFSNPRIGIRRGGMTLSGKLIKSFFDIWVNEITASVDQQIKGTEVSYMLLVGGFGDSPFLRQAFKNQYEPQGCEVTLTNDSTSKAVAEGAVIWSIISSVVGRAPHSSFGIEIAVLNDPTSPEFRGRQVYTCPSGEEKVSGVWAQIVAKGIVIDADAVNRRSFSVLFPSAHPHLDDFEVTLLSYSKPGQPKWARTKKGAHQQGFQKSVTITADLTNLSGALQPAIGSRGRLYWILDFDICIRFGGTEFEAYLEWEEDGATCKGDVIVVPDDPI